MDNRRAPQPSPGSALLTAGAALLIPAALILLVSGSPALSLRIFLTGPWTSPFALGGTLNTAALLTLTGLGTALSFQAGLFNLGGEGQVYAGSLAAALAALSWPGCPAPLAPAAALLAALTAGALLGSISGLLKGLAQIDELLTTFLLSSALIPLIDYLVTGPLNDPGSNLLAARIIPEAFHLPQWLPPSPLSWALPLALAAVSAALAIRLRTRLGFLWRIAGRGEELAWYTGLSRPLYALMPLAVSGALHGLAGGLLTAGTHHTAVQGGAAGLGWNGIAVALIARLNPAWIIPSALLFAWLTQGAEAARLHGDVSMELGGIVQALVLLLVGAQFLPSLRRAPQEQETAL